MASVPKVKVPKTPVEMVYLPKLFKERPVVGSLAMRQPLSVLAAFTPVNRIPTQNEP